MKGATGHADMLFATECPHCGEPKELGESLCRACHYSPFYLRPQPPKRLAPVHKCSVCGRRAGSWGPGWRWYGSMAQLDEGKPIVKMCSKQCAAQAKDNGLIPSDTEAA